MLTSQVITALYLLSLSDPNNALPMSAIHYQGSNFGHEQTTQQSRPTTTIDYDLADFDEFGNDPGLYDVAGSPDIINIADDKDQGYDYQTGIDTGQSWLEPLYTVSPGVSRFPGGSGGISDEVQESVNFHSEGGPTDEGFNPKPNHDQVVKDRQMPDNNDNRIQQPENRRSISDKNKQKTIDASLSVNASISSLKDIALPLNSIEGYDTVITGNLSNKRDLNHDDGESRKQSDNGRVTSTSPDSNRTGRTSSSQPADQISQPKKHSSVRSGDSTRDKYSDITAGVGDVAGETTGHISQRKKDSSVSSGISARDKYSEAVSGAYDVSEMSAETSFSSEDFSDGSMADESINKYSVFDSNSQELSSTSRSVEHTDSEGISSMEDLSGEDMRTGVKSSARHSQDKSVSKESGISGDDKFDSLGSSEQNSIYSTAYDGSRSSVHNDGSHSSEQSGSHSSSGESDSKSVETSDSHFPSDESGSWSAETPVSQSLSDESGSQSAETSGSESDETGSQSDSSSSSDENSSQSGSASSSDENGSQSTEAVRFKSSFEDDQKMKHDTTESKSNTNDNDIDLDNDSDLPGMDFHHSIPNDPSSRSSTLSPGSQYKENHSDNKDGGKASATQADELTKCFAPSVDDGKYCYLLRSLYSICNFQFKKACASGKEKQSNDEDSTYYNPNSFRYISDDSSSESMEESDSGSYITSIGSSSSLQSSSNSLSIETVENLSASFERSNNIFEVISLIKDTCPSICALAESYSQNTAGKHHGLNRVNIGSVEDYDSSESMDEDDSTETSNEAYSDSDEDETGSHANSNNDASRKAQSQEFSDSDEYQSASQMISNNVVSGKTQSEASQIQVNNISKGDYSIEDNTNESSVDISFASNSDSKYSAESSGGQSFEYNSGTSDSASK